MPVDPVAVGAFLSGVAAVISSAYAIRGVHRRDDEECERRLAAFREGLKRGREK